MKDQFAASAEQRELRRGKTPSELGEEVLAIALKGDAGQSGQRQTAPGSTTAGDTPASCAPASSTAIAGAAGESAASYSSAARRPAGATSYSNLAASKPTVSKREKTPSELGDEVVARVLVEEGQMDPKDLEEYLANFEEPSAQAFTDAGLNENAIRGAQWGNSISSMLQNLNEKAAPIRATPEWQALADAQNLTYAGLDENALKGLEYGDSLFRLNQKADAIRATPEWQALADAQNLTYAGLDGNALKGLEYGDSLFRLNQKADTIRATPEWQVLTDIQNLIYAGVDGNAQQSFETGRPIGKDISQFIDETHLAPGTSFRDYVADRFKSGLWNGAEGVWNNTVDFARALTNADLAQQIEQVKQYAWLGEPYQNSADLVEDSVRTVQEAVPEAAEGLRSHQAAKYARQIDELYDAGGLYRLGGDVAASIGQMAPSIAMKILTGDVGSMAYLYASASGNAAAEARAGGADEETAQLYGMLSGSIKVLTEQVSYYITGEDEGVLNQWLMGMAESKTGRAALNYLVSTLGEGAQEFISEIAGAYLDKMWNGDENENWQISDQTSSDAFYQGLVGTLTKSIMSLPRNISKMKNVIP